MCMERSHFHFWNLEQPSVEKEGIDQTYQAPFQEAVTSPLPTPLGVERNSVFLSLHAFLRCQVRAKSPKALSHPSWQGLSLQGLVAPVRRVGVEHAAGFVPVFQRHRGFLWISVLPPLGKQLR